MLNQSQVKGNTFKRTLQVKRSVSQWMPALSVRALSVFARSFANFLKPKASWQWSAPPWWSWLKWNASSPWVLNVTKAVDIISKTWSLLSFLLSEDWFNFLFLTVLSTLGIRPNNYLIRDSRSKSDCCCDGWQLQQNQDGRTSPRALSDLKALAAEVLRNKNPRDPKLFDMIFCAWNAVDIDASESGTRGKR